MFRCKLLLSISIVVLVLAFVGAVQANVVQNVSFEDGFDGWTTWQWNSGSFAISTDAFQGLRSAAFDTVGGVWSGGAGAFQGVAVGEGAPVSISAFAKGVSTGGFVGIDLCFFAVAPVPGAMDPPTIGRVELPLSSFVPVGAYLWTFGLLNAVTPVGTTYMKFEVSDNGNPGPSPILFDNVVGTIPEPATIALLGLGGLALIRRKR